MKDSYSQAEKDRLFLHYGIRHNTSLFTRLTDAFGEPGEICDAFRSGRSGSMHGIREDVVSKLTEAAKPGFVDRLCDRLSESGIRMTAPGEEDYPFLLEQIDNPPYPLFYKGKLIREPALPIGVIGSRRCTGYGKSIARMFSYDLARSGAVIVSGMAAGIDTEAARGALEAKESEYPTIAVLGTGIDVVYPKQNYELYNEIASRGALVSEFFLGDKPLPDHFPIRNRIISGLSKGVLVVEAGERSGSSITAGLALDQGRDLYAVPGRITDPMSVGTNRLIQQGAAKPVFCTGDILCEYGIRNGSERSGLLAYVADSAVLDPFEKKICDALRGGELHADTLADRLSVTAGELGVSLTSLTFSGIIKQLPGRVYTLEILRADSSER